VRVVEVNVEDQARGHELHVEAAPLVPLVVGRPVAVRDGAVAHPCRAVVHATAGDDVEGERAAQPVARGGEGGEHGLAQHLAPEACGGGLKLYLGGVPADVLAAVGGEREAVAVIGHVRGLDDGVGLGVERCAVGDVAPQAFPSALEVGEQSAEHVLVGELGVGPGAVAVVELRIAEPKENSEACAESNGEYKREDIIDAVLVELFEQCLMLLRQVCLHFLRDALQKFVLEGGEVVDGGQKNIGILLDICLHRLTPLMV